MIHLGDIRDGKNGKCEEATYKDVSDIFTSSPVPTFFIPGDNGWTDCHNIDDAFGYNEQHLLHFIERNGMLSWANLPGKINRSEQRMELFSFVIDNVLFLGQNLPGGWSEPNEKLVRGQWPQLLSDNLNWTKYNFDKYGNDINAVVIFGHSSSASNAYYFRGLIPVANRYNEVPILFLEDGNEWEVDRFFLAGAPNVLRIVTDNTVTPVKFTVNLRAVQGPLEEVFEVERGCPCTTDHRPTKVVWSCADVCAVQERCGGVNPCSPKGWIVSPDGMGCVPEGV